MIARFECHILQLTHLHFVLNNEIPEMGNSFRFLHISVSAKAIQLESVYPILCVCDQLIQFFLSNKQYSLASHSFHHVRTLEVLDVSNEVFALFSH